MEEGVCLLPGCVKVEVGHRHHHRKGGPSKSKGRLMMTRKDIFE